ncbi:Orotidine 5'-phosphate decarboxylase [Kingella potus]|uniref:Orotidine 5'-phosphate decarboxylase n=1 Tax=Kingella potus TaxID=265175 RepID=A0A377QZK2_9NEIS|nr:orotidine-5'-phosphate decarboxylase [Kingella potus]UOP01473.1 orotidine-5'-phosphate decarboxylase [Kingella potus]STR00205.1 Orotidine 5'-phosphate decarboxylase [Kingella potus]
MNPLITDPAAGADRAPVIVALDFAGEAAALAFVRRLDPSLCRLKIGKELFTATGRKLADNLINQGFKLFLDLKYHDIPHTVAQACKAAAEMGVWMVDMHASGGRRMMEAAAEAVAQYQNKPLLIGVTVLTSMTQQELAETGVSAPIEEQVLHLADLAQSSGLDGVVCSALEAAPLRRRLGRDFVLVTPGIRPDPAANSDDQRRIMTPAQALAAGSTYLVMGRPVTQAADPVAILREINETARRQADAEAV